MKYDSISILGATGSIGTQTLEVIRETAPEIRVRFLTANKNIGLLEKLAYEFQPYAVVVANEEKCAEFKKTTKFRGEILSGTSAVNNIAAVDPDSDIILNSLVGFAGVLPTWNAVNAGKTVALANKESLVAAGNVIMPLAKSSNTKIIPVDSEHSAVLQSIQGENYANIEKIILTASGGPFRNRNRADFESITLEEALNHPNWSMGDKITIDSATMMNKGFEVIEAMWLFGVGAEKIDVVIHPESVIHSMVQFCDGAIKAQLGVPDMKIPIAYALSIPDRLKLGGSRLDWKEYSNLTFIEPDFEKFQCLRLAKTAITRGGNSGAIINAANDAAVSLFLRREIGFTDIPLLINFALENGKFISEPSITEIVETNSQIRSLVLSKYLELTKTNTKKGINC